MSRVAKMPVKIPAGVQITSANGVVAVKGAKSSLNLPLPQGVVVEMNDGVLNVSEASVKSHAMQSGTVRALMPTYSANAVLQSV